MSTILIATPARLARPSLSWSAVGLRYVSVGAVVNEIEVRAIHEALKDRHVCPKEFSLVAVLSGCTPAVDSPPPAVVYNDYLPPAFAQKLQCNSLDRVEIVWFFVALEPGRSRPVARDDGRLGDRNA